jgi:hypothetical protein
MCADVTWDGPPAEPTNGASANRAQAPQKSLRQQIFEAAGTPGNGAVAHQGADGFELFASLVGLMGDREAVAAQIAKFVSERNAAATEIARAAKATKKLEADREAFEAERASFAAERDAGREELWRGQQQLDWDRREWTEQNAETIALASRYRESLRVDIDMGDPAQMARLHAGNYGRMGQREEAEATKRRSAADLHAERLVAATPEVQFAAGTSISRSSGPARRG